VRCTSLHTTHYAFYTIHHTLHTLHHTPHYTLHFTLTLMSLVTGSAFSLTSDNFTSLFPRCAGFCRFTCFGTFFLGLGGAFFLLAFELALPLMAALSLSVCHSLTENAHSTDRAARVLPKLKFQATTPAGAVVVCSHAIHHARATNSSAAVDRSSRKQQKRHHRSVHPNACAHAIPLDGS
jgi:hypothetical protein